MVNVEAIPGQGIKKYEGDNPQRALLMDLLNSHKSFRDFFPNLAIDYLYGNSFGLYAALVASGSTDESQALHLADARMTIVRETELGNPSGPSEMWALVGAGREVAEKIAGSIGACLSNDNGPFVQVLAGYAHIRERLEQYAQELGIRRVISLQTGGAFHSPLRQEDSERYAEQVEKADISNPVIPLISSTSPRLLVRAGDIKDELVSQMVKAVEHPLVLDLFGRLGVTNVFETGPGVSLKKSFSSINARLAVFSLERERESLKKLFNPSSVTFAP